MTPRGPWLTVLVVVLGLWCQPTFATDRLETAESTATSTETRAEVPERAESEAPAATPAESLEPAETELIESRAQSRDWKVMGVYGGHIGMPERVRGSAGLFFFRNGINPYGANGFGISVEPGLDGGRLSLAAGHFNLFGSTLARLTFLRTWDEPWDERPNRSFLGVEGQIPIPLVPMSALRLGALRNLDDSSDWLFSWSVGLGF